MNIEAFKYQVEISDSALDMIHGLKYTIEEIYVPEFHLAFNERGGIFQTDEPRAKKGLKIQVDKDDVRQFLDFLIQKSVCQLTIKKYYPNFKGDMI